MFILKNNEKTILVSDDFVKNSLTLTNLLNDLDGWEDKTEPIPLPLDFDSLTKFYDLFEEIKDIICDGRNIFNYLVNHLDEYIDIYPKKNMDPPFQPKIIQISKNLSYPELLVFIKHSNFLNMLGMMRFLSLVYSHNIKNMENYDEKLEIFRKIRNKLK